MQNIHLIYALPVAITTLISIALLLYWKAKRRLTPYILLYSFVAYFLAIGSKSLFQDLTYKPLIAMTSSPLMLGIYFGAQTMLLEVGLAYVFARVAIYAKNMRVSDAAGYGIGLAFWENGILLGLVPLVNLLVVYLALAHPNGASASTVYNSVLATKPQLFVAPQASVLLSNTLYSVMERTSSILIHLSWGVLVVFAAFYRKKKYLFLALPMGLIDFLVPFAPAMSIPVFESIILALSVMSVLVTLFVIRGAVPRARKARRKQGRHA